MKSAPGPINILILLFVSSYINFCLFSNFAWAASLHHLPIFFLTIFRARVDVTFESGSIEAWEEAGEWEMLSLGPRCTPSSPSTVVAPARDAADTGGSSWFMIRTETRPRPCCVARTVPLHPAKPAITPLIALLEAIMNSAAGVAPAQLGPGGLVGVPAQ